MEMHLYIWCKLYMILNSLSPKGFLIRRISNKSQTWSSILTWVTKSPSNMLLIGLMSLRPYSVGILVASSGRRELPASRHEFLEHLSGIVFHRGGLDLG